MLLASFRVASLVSFSFVSELWGFVWLRWVVYFMDSFFIPCGISGKMTIPSKSLLSLLASCSLYCYVALPTTFYIIPPILPCQASNPPFLANRCVAMLPLLLSPSYSVVSCRWSWRLLHVELVYWDNIIYIPMLINTYILAMGEMLVLLFGILFHSCRPSFRHTGVMFLDFAFLTRLGVMGTPWQFALNKTPPARPNLGFTICHLSLFPLGSADSRVIFIFPPPPGPVLLRVLVQTRSLCSATLGKLEAWF